MNEQMKWNWIEIDVDVPVNFHASQELKEIRDHWLFAWIIVIVGCRRCRYYVLPPPSLSPLANETGLFLSFFFFFFSRSHSVYFFRICTIFHAHRRFKNIYLVTRYSLCSVFTMNEHIYSNENGLIGEWTMDNGHWIT